MPRIRLTRLPRCEAGVELYLNQGTYCSTTRRVMYENHLGDAPEGETYEILYDLKSNTPLARYQKLYDEVREELKKRGLPLV
jgi:hypothetical protein